ncbi:MAG: hypothetical protein AABX63_01070 [Nanoarchaeota archaeon]
MKDKIEYAYVSTLEAPQTYQYSEFLGKEFVDSYKDFRLKIMDSLKVSKENLSISIQNYAKQFAGLNKKNLLKRISEENFTKNILSMLLYIQNSIELKDKEISNEVYKRLSIFIRKYEVSKKIFSQYSNNLEKIGENYREIDNYVLLSLNLALFYRSSKNLKFINIVLKINDMLCGMKDNIKADVLPLFYLSLKIELDEIKNLFKEKGLKL